MLNTRQLIAGFFMAALCTAPLAAHAGEPPAVGCSVSVTYLLNRVVRSTYATDFTVTPTAPFADDFSTAVRFRYFDALASRDADGKATDVSISYYNDVGVFEFVDLRTALSVREDRRPQTTSGEHTYWSSLGVAGEHTTRWVLTCEALKD